MTDWRQSTHTSTSTSTNTTVSDRFCVLGGRTTAFAKVFLVRKRTGTDKGKLFAMKVLKKAKVIKDARSITNTKAERHILQEVNHPFMYVLSNAVWRLYEISLQHLGNAVYACGRIANSDRYRTRPVHLPQPE